MLPRSRLAGYLLKRVPCRPQVTLIRYKSQISPAQNQDSRQDPAVNVEQNYFRPTSFTTDYFKRVIKFSLVGIFIVGVTVGTAFEATHMWVENVELAPDLDDEVRKWEWDIQADKWSSGNKGGTDPALGFKGRHAVRSAWMAENWGTGSSTSVIGSKAVTGQGSGGLNVVESKLEFAQDFLNIAINVALSKKESGSPILPETLNALVARHASLMELMGSKNALFEARLEFERLWKNVLQTGVDAARIAHKLGDLNSRLGDSEDALVWWARAIQLACGEGSSKVLPVIPQVAPSSPLAQRTMISTLISLSTYYATTGQLRQAQMVEESSLDLLRSIKQPEYLSSTSPAHALHALYILHRSALLSIHLAEVLHGLRNSPETSMRWLTSAAESSERVAIILLGLPPIHPDAPNSEIPHPPSFEAPLVQSYTKSTSMRKPASNLLRDARRSAAEAWHLIGLLKEGSDPASAAEALECYERALGWVGIAADKAGGGVAKPGDGTLAAEWDVLWRNYVRAREKIQKSQ